MTDGILIREYRPEDEAALVGLVRELQDVERGWYDRMRPAAEIGPWYVERLLAQCVRDQGRILIAERNGLPVGYATIYVGLTTEDDRDVIEFRYGHVGDLAVTETSRGRGVGSALLAECEARARAAGLGWLSIGAVFGNEPARRLYARLGFRPRHVSLEKKLD